MKITNKTAKEVKFRTGNLGIKIEFPFDRETLGNVRSLSGRKYYDTPQGKFWTAPLTIDAINSLQSWGFILCPSLEKRIQTSTEIQFNPDIKLPELKRELFPYQKEGVAFLEALKGRGIIGDEMGLGKTIQSIAWLELNKEKALPAIIVCPGSLKLMWAKEIKEWTYGNENNIEVLFGKTPYPITGKIIIVNYEIIYNWMKDLLKIKPVTCIVDEAQNIMHEKSGKKINKVPIPVKQTYATLGIIKKCKNIIGLSGTSILNRPMEAYNIIRAINSTILPASKFEFGMKYCGGKHNGFGWEFKGASNLPELNKIFKKVMIRRLKKDVLKELPEKIRSVVPLELNNYKEYKNAENDFIRWVIENKGRRAAIRANALTKTEALKQLAVEGKFDSACKWITNYLENENKLVVFVTHRKTAENLHAKFKNSVMLIGGLSSEKIESTVQAFQKNAKVNLLIGMLDSRGRPAGVGHTLTAASATAFIEMPWSPGICDQAEDRVHRIGQTADSVYAYYLIAEDSIEIKISNLLDSKRKIVNAVLDGTTTDDDSLLIELLRSYEDTQECSNERNHRQRNL